MRKIRIRKRNHSNSRASHCQFRKVQLTALVIMTCIACGVSSARTSKLYPPRKTKLEGCESPRSWRLQPVRRSFGSELASKNYLHRD